jgi:hypothetical protein
MPLRSRNLIPSIAATNQPITPPPGAATTINNPATAASASAAPARDVPTRPARRLLSAAFKKLPDAVQWDFDTSFKQGFEYMKKPAGKRLLSANAGLPDLNWGFDKDEAIGGGNSKKASGSSSNGRRLLSAAFKKLPDAVQWDFDTSFKQGFEYMKKPAGKRLLSANAGLPDLNWPPRGFDKDEAIGGGNSKKASGSSVPGR